MHGYGVMKYKNGDKYEGEWNNGSKIGIGISREFPGNMEENGYMWTISDGFCKGLNFGTEGAIIYTDGTLKRGKFVPNYPYDYRFVSDPNKKVSKNKKIEILIKKATKESKKNEHKINKIIKNNKMVRHVELLKNSNFEAEANYYKVSYEEGLYIGKFGENGLRKGKGTMKYNNSNI